MTRDFEILADGNLPERRSVLGEKNGRVKRIIVVLLLSTIYNNVRDNNKDNDKKKK